MQMHATKTVKFCAAHRLLNYTGKCKNLHGHNYTVEITLASIRHTDESPKDFVDDKGMLVDFGQIGSTIGKWVNANWDHSTIVTWNDSDLFNFCSGQESRIFVLPPKFMNTTAECMCMFLMELFADTFVQQGAILENIKIWETDTGAACCSRY